MLSDVNPGGGLLNVDYQFALFALNGILYFPGSDGTDGTQLCDTNPTAGGLAMVSDVDPGAGFAYVGDPTNVNGTLFFVANDATYGTQLWESDGTSAGTFMVTDINPDRSYVGNLTNVNGTLFFTANDPIHGNELWELQTNPATTTAVASSSSTSVFGQVVTLTATVSDVASGIDPPAGSVTFMDGTTVLGSAPLDSSDTATFATSTLAVVRLRHYGRLWWRFVLHDQRLGGSHADGQ